MSGPRAIARSARDSQGAVLVLVALMLPVLVGVGGLVVDVGNWFAHKRHLQVQADAGALAGAGKFRFPCENPRINDEVARYSSVEYSGSQGYAGVGTGFNPQQALPVGGFEREMNSKTFFNQASPVDGTVREGEPCAAKMVDVKLTETDLPWYLKALNVPFINAHARVEIRRQMIAKNLLPLGVPNVEPRMARAFFVDESKATTDANYVIASTNLVRTGTQDGLAIWSNPSSGSPALPVTVALKVDVSKIGVRVAIGETTTPLTGSYETVCAMALVTCWDKGAANGLVNIRGWSSTPAGSLTAPHARGVDLFGATCTDGYFNVLTASCTIGVRATVDFGAGSFGPDNPKPAGVKLQARRGGSNYDMSYDQVTGTWSSSAISVAPDADGPLSIDLLWSTGCPSNGNGKCDNTGTIAGVQRSFEGSGAVSGPVELVKISEAGSPGANSFELGSTHDLVVRIGLTGSLAVAALDNDPAVTLKFNQGGLTGFLDCDPDLPKVSDEIAQGCKPPYTVNTGNPCPFASTPLQCVPVEPGNKVGLLAPGLNLRILGYEKPSVCSSPNNWQGPNVALPEGDPRIVQLFLTPLGAFDGNGNGTVPVLGFSAFYVTGWQGVGAEKNPCQQAGKGDDPANTGEIRGHFIKYIDLSNPEGASEDVCDFSDLSPCVATFTR